METLLSADPDARIMMRWWWFGPTITPKEIDRELGLMKDAGIGGVEVAFLYPVTLRTEASPELYDFLSPAFLNSLGHAAESAKRLGLVFDITLGSGWPYGGPHVTAPLQARKLKILDVTLDQGISEYEVPKENEDAEIVAATCGGRPVEFTKRHAVLHGPLNKPSRLRLLLSVPTGQRVKRAAQGAEGFALDHYNEESLAAHLAAVGEPLLQATGRNVRAIFCDSLEVYHSNWTCNFLAEFKRLRGYDLDPHLPALLDAMDMDDDGNVSLQKNIEPPDAVHGLLHDYAQTLQELCEQRFLQPLRNFADRHGAACRVQVYGIPPTSLSSYRHVDIPEGETTLGDSDICLPADWTELTPNRFAASAAKHYGHRIISGETWTRLHSPPYAATLLDMKAEADRFFLQGINQLIGHGWCQKPADGDPSQWVFYAAANFNEANPWHPILPELSRYLQRICSIMRKGKAVADVAVYLPDHDVMSCRTFSELKTNLHHVNGLRDHIGTNVPKLLLSMGYNFDLVDDHIIEETARDNRLAQKIILLPHVTRIPLQTLMALQSHCRNGILLIALGKLPERSAGYARQNESQEVARLSREIFASGGHANAIFQPSIDLAEWVRSLPPDVSLDQATPEIGYIHRKLADVDLYLFCNTTNRRIEFTPRFRDTGCEVDWVNPFSGSLVKRSTGAVRLEAFESVVAIARNPRETHESDSVVVASDNIGESFKETKIAPPWTLTVPSRGICRTLESLQPWTDFEDLRHFSGEAVYACTFHCDMEAESATRVCLVFEEPRPIEPHIRQAGRRNTGFSVFLDTPIMDAAVVFINGKRIGTLFAPPYTLDLGHALTPGGNLLEIKVYNRLVNELSNRPLFDFAPIHAAYGTRFDDIQDFTALRAEPSGIKGTLKLRFFT